MACYCAVAVAAVMAVAFVCLRSVDSPEGALQVLAILAGAVAAMMVGLRRPGDGNSAQAVTFCD